MVGVNQELFDPERHFIVSNASCTTNCLAVLAKVLDDAFGIEDGFMTTVHAYTGDQSLVDALHKDPRRSRAAAVNIVPTTTGAARATGLVLPSVAGTLDGLALRVPVPDASITDLVANVRGTPTVPEIRARVPGSCRIRSIARASRVLGRAPRLFGHRRVSLLVRVRLELTMAHGHLVKVLGWYDNESGYASRLVDLAAIIGRLRSFFRTDGRETGMRQVDCLTLRTTDRGAHAPSVRTARQIQTCPDKLGKSDMPDSGTDRLP